MSVFGKPRTLTVIMFLVVLFFQTSITQSSAFSIPQRSPADVLSLEEIGYPESLDPHITFEEYGMWAVSNIYETLYTYPWGSSRVEPLIPLLASETPAISPDGLTYTIRLREEVTFHDNTPFNASCVKWNFERLMKISYQFGPAHLFGRVLKGGIAVVDAAALNGTTSSVFKDTFDN